ncbi:MAG: DUF2934 domain-containing protein [Rhodospirillaceae bacterium]|nr:DUF2934 domain-containing protein [Rhodospirillaceae bacterium]
MSDPVHDKISERAFALWEQAGRPDGCDVDHWLAAEAEIRTGSAGVKKAAPRKTAPKKTAAIRKEPAARKKPPAGP